MMTTTPYYRPSAPEAVNARAIKSFPRTDSVLLFERHGVIIGVNTVYKSVATGYPSNELILHISIEVPDGKKVRLGEYSLEVYAPSGKSWSTDLTGHVWSSPGRTTEFPVYGEMIGRNKAWRWGTSQGYGNTTHAAFFFSASIVENAELASLEVKLPIFQINGADIELPNVSFSLQSEDLWYSVP